MQSNISTIWSLNSWKNKANQCSIEYNNKLELEEVICKLSKLPPLINITDISYLTQKLKDVSEGKCFLLHAGDCAELFENSTPQYVNSQLNLLKSLSISLGKNINKDICCIGRIAGQYAKPRTKALEPHNDVLIHSYFGDIVNSYLSDINLRMPDPQRMVQAYDCAKKTIQYIHDWHKINNIKIFTSHEALLLPFEQALTRKTGNLWFNASCHLPWVGMRTVINDSAHIEYVRGINNPVAIKVGPNLEHELLLRAINLINPLNKEGRIILIYRYGCSLISQKLPSLINVLKASNIKAILCCDPMHGNTKTDLQGLKVRYINEIENEIISAIQIHKTLQWPLGGLHLEATSDDVYECIFPNNSLASKFRSKVDPRLNAEQAEHLINLVINQINT